MNTRDPNDLRNIAASAADYERRVSALEAEGLTRSDAQGVADAQDMHPKAPTLASVLRSFLTDEQMASPEKFSQQVRDAVVVLAHDRCRREAAAEINRRNTECPILAKFQVGEETCESGLGAIIVRIIGQQFEVYADGGLLPCGSGARRFTSAAKALRVAVAIAATLAAQEGDDIDN